MSTIATEKPLTTDITAWIESNLSTTGLVQDLRKEGLSYFQQLGIPANKAEEYKFTPIARLLEKNFNFSTRNAEAKSIDINHYAIPGLDANVLVFVNGVYAAQYSKIISPATEVTILPLREAIDTKKDLILVHLGKHADHKADALTAWNTASWSDGVFIHVGKNTIVEKPIVLYHIHDVREGQTITHHRNLFIVEQSAEVTVIEKFDSEGTGNGFSNVVTEGVVAENAGLNLYEIQNDGGARYHYNHIHMTQANASRVNTFTFSLDGKLIRNNLQLCLDGEGIESHMYGLYALTGDTLADNHTVVDHRKPNSFSNELYKGILDGQSKGVFNGKIFVRPNAQKTNAFQANRNILLTDKATVNTKPQLEIWADDVKCSHGCTTGQLDEEAVFYLQARGISKETARAMMLYAFAGEVLDAIKHPVIKEYIDTIISERLHKNF
ncbi:Fe-S cluster assembly protein SufD [Pseudochryseolinea flava]|uniref:Fe-S cluster assembly protein SufD n=1 Tax=Pseudochryseolinea flava TaxID=2059302 RepID=A0A364Y3U9_9BACT|nr:Fe-S cluster assembly protein SufD [Pseudochryseolinea flava]RAW01456.1 Fe-S cluster assembly protein SufD [Pseudochryseolinea flava]